MLLILLLISRDLRLFQVLMNAEDNFKSSSPIENKRHTNAHQPSPPPQQHRFQSLLVRHETQLPLELGVTANLTCEHSLYPNLSQFTSLPVQRSAKPSLSPRASNYFYQASQISDLGSVPIARSYPTMILTSPQQTERALRCGCARLIPLPVVLRSLEKKGNSRIQ